LGGVALRIGFRMRKPTRIAICTWRIRNADCWQEAGKGKRYYSEMFKKFREETKKIPATRPFREWRRDGEGRVGELKGRNLRKKKDFGQGRFANRRALRAADSLRGDREEESSSVCLIKSLLDPQDQKHPGGESGRKKES